MSDTLRVEVLRASERRRYRWPSPDGTWCYYVNYTIAINGIEAGDVQIHEDGKVILPYGTWGLLKDEDAQDRLAGVRDLEDLRARLAALEEDGLLQRPVLVNVERDDDGRPHRVFIGCAGMYGHSRGITLNVHEWPLIRQDLVAAGLLPRDPEEER